MNTTTMLEIISLILRTKCTFTIRFTNIFITSVLLISVISPTIAAPSPYVIAVNPPNHKTVLSTICSNPCGVDREDTSPKRHWSRDPLKVVRNQLNLTLSDLQHINKTIMYGTYKSTMNLTKQFRGLPQKQYQEYVTFIGNHPDITNVKKIDHLLPKLYGYLCRYGGAFQRLSSMVPHTMSSAPLDRNRNKILESLNERLKALICEVETSINVTNIAIPMSVKNGITRVEKDWPTNPDRTTALTVDMSAFSQYKTFLEDWLKITREVENGPRNNRRTDRRRPLKKKPRRPKVNKKRNIKPRKPVRQERS